MVARTVPGGWELGLQCVSQLRSWGAESHNQHSCLPGPQVPGALAFRADVPFCFMRPWLSHWYSRCVL